MYSQPLRLIWCDGCECYAAAPDHSCADKLAQREALKAGGPARVEKRWQASRNYQKQYREHCATKRAERRKAS